MLYYIFKRLLMIAPVILGVTLIIFAIMSMTPGDPAMMILGEGAKPEQYAALREQMGLNDSFAARYARYVWGALRGDFGRSYRTNLPVFQEISARLPYTLYMAVFSTIIAVALGLPIGVLSAVKQYTLSDNMALGVSLLLTSMPTFWLAMMLVLIFALKWKWLPSLGTDTWKHFILPSAATAASTTAALLRMTRSTMLEVIRQDYIRTARAKGAKESRVIFGHALRNALLPVVTVIGVNFGVALGGTIVVEQVFAIPGLGQLIVNAIRSKDTPMVAASVLFAAIISCAVNLLVDIVYAYIDPRLKAKYARPSKNTRKIRGTAV
jgi:peptide/nickel transport system permease protein